MSDWRLQGQDKYLSGVSLSWKPYRKRRDDWDHDHCEFCWAKFSESEDDLNEGYVTDDGHRWTYPTCFRAFRKCKDYADQAIQGRRPFNSFMEAVSVEISSPLAPHQHSTSRLSPAPG